MATLRGLNNQNEPSDIILTISPAGKKDEQDERELMEITMMIDREKFATGRFFLDQIQAALSGDEQLLTELQRA